MADIFEAPENSLMVIKKGSALTVLTSGLDNLIQGITDKVQPNVADISKAKGRNEIISNAAKVTKSKTYIAGVIDDLIEAKKQEIQPTLEVIEALKSSKKKSNKELAELAKSTRGVVTDWEVEQKRLKEEEAAKVKAEEKENDHEFALMMADKFDRDLKDAQEEAAKIAKEMHERELEIEAKRIKRFEEEAAEAARIEAEAKAKAEIELVEREKRELVEREQIAKEQAEQAKRNQIAAEERAKVQAELAEKARVAAEKQAKLNAELVAHQAREYEIERQKEIHAEKEKDEADRLANRAHVSKVRSEAKEALIYWGLTEEAAKKVVMAINDGKIPHVKINY